LTGQTLVGGLDGQTNIQLAGTDPGDGSPIGFTLTGPSSLGNIPIFNVQSIIEAPRKKSFFHNAAFTTSIEDAASFYFTDAFVANGNSAGFGNSAFEGPPLPNAGSLPNPLPRAPGQPEANPSGGPALALQELADTYFSPTDPVGGQDVLDTLGFFLRALNVVYSIADCERLTDDAIDRVQAGLPLEVPVLNCTTDLNDVNRVVGGAQVVVPSSYLSAQTEALQIATDLNEAAKERNAAKLTAIVSQLKTLRHSIATISPDLQ